MSVVRAKDVADYILSKKGSMTAIKLQKLVYYSQAWHLVWLEKKLFNDKIEAWVNGPVIKSLYDQHRGKFDINKGFFKGDISRLTIKNREAIDKVLKFYGDKTSQWLIELTHLEDPWINARIGLSDRERGSKEITLSSMLSYYSSI